MNSIHTWTASALKRLALTASVVLLLAGSARSAIIISEVNPGGSNASYGADWFELTNTGAAAVNIAGWKIDDSSNASASAVPLVGVTSLAPGQSAVFLEGNSSGSNLALIDSNFTSFWFGSNVPAGFAIGNYFGSMVGLSTTAGDGVNIFDSSDNFVTGVSFGVFTVGATLDNSAGLSSTTISTTSVAGVHGAFVSVGTTSETGSPGVVPEPSSEVLLCLGAGLLTLSRVVEKRRRAASES